MQPPVKIKAPTWLAEFQAFIMRGSVVDLITTIIRFLIVGFAIFWTGKALSKLHLTEQKKAAPPPKSALLLEEIRDILKASATPAA